MAANSKVESIDTKRCQHCRQKLTILQVPTGYCCQGCRAAHQFIGELGLDSYYELLSSEELEASPVQNSNLIELFDDSEFQKSFCTLIDGSKNEARLYVGGLSCYACVWLIEKAIAKQELPVEVQINLSTGSTTVSYDPNVFKLTQLVKLIRELGFNVSPSADDHEQENIAQLVKLGVNTFCFLNVMLLAVADYLDSDLISSYSFWQLFRWLSLGLCMVVVTYGSKEFYMSALRAFKAKSVNIDQSIVIALAATFLFSLVNTVRGSGPVYFDSVCAVISLIGWGRYYQRRIMHSAERSIRGVFDFAMQYVRQASEPEGRIIPVNKLSKGEGFYVLPGDPVPVDSEILSGSGSVHYELISGEPDPVLVTKGGVVKAGAINLTQRLDLRAQENGGDSLIAKMDKMIESILSEKGNYTAISDRLGSLFFAGVMICALLILLVNWSHGPEEAISRAIAALLIACPCAFAVSVPLTFASCSSLGIKKGVILRSQRAIEHFASIKAIYFDKTGTLTVGSPAISDSYVESLTLDAVGLSEIEFKSMVASLVEYSSHHAVQALSAWTGEAARNAGGISCVSEEIGSGMSWVAFGRKWRCGKRQFCDIQRAGMSKHSANLWVSVDGNLAAEFVLEDSVVGDAADIIEFLKSRSLGVGVISGDTTDKTTLVATQLGIDEGWVFADKTPLQKIKETSLGKNTDVSAAMVGNGFNDSLALAKADIGISVANAAQQTKDIADICLLRPHLGGVRTAYELCDKARSKIIASFLFAISFNLAGLSLAAFGLMHPVVAAIAMPLSSLTVITISTKWPRRLR